MSTGGREGSARTGLDGIGQDGMGPEGIGADWIGSERVGKDRRGSERKGRVFSSFSLTERSGGDWSGAEWKGKDRSGWERSGLERIGVERTGREWFFTHTLTREEGHGAGNSSDRGDAAVHAQHPAGESARRVHAADQADHVEVAQAEDGAGRLRRRAAGVDGGALPRRGQRLLPGGDGHQALLSGGCQGDPTGRARPPWLPTPPAFRPAAVPAPRPDAGRAVGPHRREPAQGVLVRRLAPVPLLEDGTGYRHGGANAADLPAMVGDVRGRAGQRHARPRRLPGDRRAGGGRRGAIRGPRYWHGPLSGDHHGGGGGERQSRARQGEAGRGRGLTEERNGPERSGMEWSGGEWIGREWIGSDRIGMERSGADRTGGDWMGGGGMGKEGIGGEGGGTDRGG